MGYRIVNGKIHVVGDFVGYDKSGKTVQPQVQGKSFDDLLTEKINKKNGFVISNHAACRLKQRNINFNENDMKNINEGINKAEAKGCKQALIMYKNTALVTSIKNRTIITAVDNEGSKENVFTNIDSAVIL